MILELMDRVERRRDKFESDFRRFREAVVAAGHPKREVIFPEFFPVKEEKFEGQPIPESADVDYSEVEWKMPSNAEEEYKALMAQVAANRNGSFGGEQLMDPDAGWR